MPNNPTTDSESFKFNLKCTGNTNVTGSKVLEIAVQ